MCIHTLLLLLCRNVERTLRCTRTTRTEQNQLYMGKCCLKRIQIAHHSELQISFCRDRAVALLLAPLFICFYSLHTEIVHRVRHCTFHIFLSIIISMYLFERDLLCDKGASCDDAFCRIRVH